MSLGMMAPDRPTAIDRLGQEPLVVGLGRLLDDPCTALPLTIGIGGRWGAGKSSLMLQLAEYLTSPARSSESRRWFPVRFEAWRYQGRETVWVGLARAIYEQCQGHRLRERVWFRVRLEVRRRGFVRSAAAVFVLLIGFGLAVSVAGKQFAGDRDLIVDAGFAAAALSALTAAISYLGIVGQPFSRALHRSGPAKAFEDFLGVTHQAERDLNCLFRTITPAGQRQAIVVLLDDLDRCLPSTITETLATITEVFAKHDDRAVAFVLGVDLDIVASAVSNSLRDISTELATLDPRRSAQLSEQYLEKIFQLSVTVSGRPQFNLDRLLFGLQDADGMVLRGVGGTATTSTTYDVDLVSSWAARIIAAEPSNPVEATLSGLFATGHVSEQDRNAMQRALRGVRAALLSVNSSDVREAELRALRPLSLTPRAIKRFDNAFRLQLQVANSSPNSQLGYSLPELTALAKWVAARMFFPRLVRVLDREPGILGELEDLATEQENFNLVTRLQELLPGTPPEVAAEAAGLLRSHTLESRITRLPLDSFLSTT
ncbi:hypothetical protein ASD81_15810 [Nocardioides sp. Root614]|nr:hypothetical protein ASD81_15810 [Nocardioides sp. Root614]KRA87585.1 hypothetical protein ASD84_16085 [Nocardioides sp. Root682]